MGKNLKFSLKSKQAAVLSVLSDRETCLSAAQKIGCDRSSVQNWVVLYRQHGKKGLSLPSRTYSAEFKMEVVDHMLKNQLSLMRTAAFFSIPSASIVEQWRKIYDRSGYLGFQKQVSDRKNSVMAKKKKTTKKDASNADPSAQKVAALQNELAYLRAENAYLKKWDALIRQEEAAKVQNKQQNSSRN